MGALGGCLVQGFSETENMLNVENTREGCRRSSNVGGGSRDRALPTMTATTPSCREAVKMFHSPFGPGRSLDPAIVAYHHEPALVPHIRALWRGGHWAEKGGGRPRARVRFGRARVRFGRAGLRFGRARVRFAQWIRVTWETDLLTA